MNPPSHKPSGEQAPHQLPEISSPFYALALVLLVVAALAIRLWNIDFGLPSFYHPDEVGKTTVVTAILAGRVPDYLSHPGLLVNSVAAVSLILRSLGRTMDPATIILTGRVLVAVIGALTLLPAALLATVLFGRRAGLIAAAILAFSPLHTIHSRYLKEDVYLTFWSLMAVAAMAAWLSRRKNEKPGASRWLALAVVSAGFAMGSKYVGVLSIALVAVAWMRPEKAARRPVWWRSALLVSCALAVFLVTTPQLILNFSAAPDDIGYELNHGIRGKGTTSLHIFEWPDVGTYFFFHGLGWGLGWPVTLLALIGMSLAWRQRRERPDIAWTAIAAVAWYALAELTPIKRGADVERYVLPCVPIWGTLASGVLAHWRPRWSPAVWKAAAAVCVLTSLVHSLLLGWGIKPDTREIAAEWLAKNGPKEPYGAVYLGEGAYQFEYRLVPAAQMNEIEPAPKKQKELARLEAAQLLATSDFFTDRYERFPRKSKKQIEALAELRAAFPYAKRFTKPFYLKAGFHNPDIELRFRKNIDGTNAQE